MSSLSTRDRTIVKRLAERVREIATDPIHAATAAASLKSS
jgi:hypothetical protein